MSAILLVGTIDGVWQMIDGVTERVRATGQHFSALALAPGVTYAATFDGVILRSRSRGASWSAWHRLPHPVHSLAASPHPGHAVYAGTWPAALYRSLDGERWEEVESFRNVPGHEAWSYPVPKREPRVSSIAFDPVDPDRLYATVEVGGTMRSRDGGRTWENIGQQVNSDAHHLTCHPTQPGVLLLTTGTAAGKPGGVYRSEDGGDSWTYTFAGQLASDTLPILIDPRLPDVCYVTATAAAPSTWLGPAGANATLYRSQDGGRTWSAVPREGGPHPGSALPVMIPDPNQPGGALVAACPPDRIAGLLTTGEVDLPLPARVAWTLRRRIRGENNAALPPNVGEIWRIQPSGAWQRWPETVAPFLAMLALED